MELPPVLTRWVEVAAHYARLREALEGDPQLRQHLLRLWHSQLPQVLGVEDLDAEERAKVFLLLEEAGWPGAVSPKAVEAQFRGARESHAVGRWRIAYHLLVAAGVRQEAAWPMLAENALDSGATAGDLASLGCAQLGWVERPPFESTASRPFLPLVEFDLLPELHQEAVVAGLSAARSPDHLRALIRQLEEQFPGFEKRVMGTQPNAALPWEPEFRSKVRISPSVRMENPSNWRALWFLALSLVLWAFLLWLIAS